MKVVFGGVFIHLIYGAPETALQLENGPAAPSLRDTQEQEKQSRMDFLFIFLFFLKDPLKSFLFISSR